MGLVDIISFYAPKPLKIAIKWGCNMFKSKLELKNVLSKNKSRKIEKLADKLAKYLKKNDVDRLTVCYMAGSCSSNGKDYINVSMYDAKDNQLLHTSYWK